MGPVREEYFDKFGQIEFTRHHRVNLVRLPNKGKLAFVEVVDAEPSPERLDRSCERCSLYFFYDRALSLDRMSSWFIKYS